MMMSGMFADLSMLATFISFIPVYQILYGTVSIMPVTPQEGVGLLSYAQEGLEQAAGALQGQERAQVAALLERGLVHIRQGHPQRAIEVYTRALTLAPADARLYFRRGEAAYLAGHYEEALADYERALRLDGRLAAAHYSRGRACHRLGAYREALASYTQALALDGSLAPAVHTARAALYQQLKAYRAALEEYDRALEYAPRDAALLFQRAIVCLQLREPRRAIADLNVVLMTRPNFACAYHYRAQAYLYLLDLSRARQDCLRASGLNPMHIDHGWLACWVEMCERRPDEQMVARLETLAEGEPGQYDAWLCRGVAAWLRGEEGLALAALLRAEELDQEHWGGPFWRAVVNASLQREEAAHAAIREALLRGLPLPLLAPLRWVSEACYRLYAGALLEE